MDLEKHKVLVGTLVAAVILAVGFTWGVSSYAKDVDAAAKINSVQTEALRREMELRFLAQDNRLGRIEQELTQIRASLDKTND